MANNELRNTLQTEAVCKLMEDHRLIVEWGTGVGKSRVAIRALSALFYAGRHRVLMLVAETEHKNNWRREFEDVLGEQIGNDLFASINVECYASLPKYAGTKWDVIVADEAHHLRSDNRTEIIATMRADYFLCLSATLSDRNDGDRMLTTLERTFGKFERVKLTLNQAVDAQILAEPRIFVHMLTLNDIKEQMEINIAWGFKNAQKDISCNIEQYKYIIANPDIFKAVNLTIRCTAKEGYEALTYQFNAAKAKYDAAVRDLNSGQLGSEQRAYFQRNLQYLQNRMLRFALLRKNLLGDCKSAFAESLLKKIEDKKYVCFCSSIEQGKRLNAENIICSQRNDNSKVVESFNKGDIRSLFAVGMIQEGANLAGIEAGVIVQLDGKERPFIQKFGRAMRSTCPEQHIILCNETTDVKYFKNAISGINQKYVTYLDATTGNELKKTYSNERVGADGKRHGFINS